MTCHSYVKGNFTEPWIKHSEEVLNVFNECFTDIIPLLSSRLNLSIDSAETIVRLSIVLHDLGKTLNVYQLRCTKLTCNESNYYGHELLGAFMVNRLLDRLVNLPCFKGSEVNEYRHLIILSVMMHHHAMRDLNDWWVRRINMVTLLDKLGSWMSELNTSELRICDECINDIIRILQLALGTQCSNYRDNINRIIKDLSNELVWGNPVNLIRDLNDWFINAKDSLIYNRSQLLILGPLVVSDNEAANRSRGSGNKRSLISYELSLRCKH